ncbi:MAG: plastocyanin/azurin family copper-binding protein, partial [Lentisphaeraceae bacterium]|nr:plastocyanin/azurin family copper-binding protein [Lentisphaeraceae bacterium]
GKPVVKKWPEIDGASTNELLELLKHPQNIIRDHARRKLRNTKGIVPIIDSWIKTIKKDELLLEALWVLQANDEVRQPVLEKLLESKDQRLRAAAVSLIRFQSAKLENPMDLLKRMTKDKHLRVRTEVIKTVSYLQEKDEAFASLLGEIDTAGDKDLKTIIADASYGAVSNKGPEIPVMNKPKDAVINKWLKQNESSKESYIDFAKRPKDRTGTIRTFVFSPENRRALLSIKHSYVKVFINGIPVIATANFWSSEWNVQVELNKGLNEIKSVFSPGRKKTGMAPVYLFNPLGVSYKDIKTGTDEASLKEMAKSYDADNGVGENAIRISAVTNQLAFTPTQIRLKAGKKVKLTFNNPDIQIHNLVIVKPGSEQEVGLLADKMIQDPDAMKKSYVPDSDKVVFYTPLLNGKQKITLDFNVPKEPGKYPFICTFPGHWRIMKGTIIVYK